MNHIVLFDDHIEKAPLRRQHFDAHLDFLNHHGAHVCAAGPLLDEVDTQLAVGGLWLTNGLSDEAVRTLVEQDPLFATGLRRSWRIHRWVKVFDEGQPTGIRP
ncbi:MAG: YciI family protein [Pseudomonadota bacterium]